MYDSESDLRRGMLFHEAGGLRAGDVAALLHVGLRTVRRWIAAGELPSVKAGACCLVMLPDLLAFIGQRRRYGTRRGVIQDFSADTFADTRHPRRNATGYYPADGEGAETLATFR